jgi:hypothetical protein
MSVRDTERLIATTLHSGNKFLDYGTVSGTTITFNHKFVSKPVVLLTPLGTGGTCAVISLDQDGDGYYITATIEESATSIDWLAIGTGIGQ